MGAATAQESNVSICSRVIGRSVKRLIERRDEMASDTRMVNGFGRAESTRVEVDSVARQGVSKTAEAVNGSVPSVAD